MSGNCGKLGVSGRLRTRHVNARLHAQDNTGQGLRACLVLPRASDRGLDLICVPSSSWSVMGSSLSWATRARAMLRKGETSTPFEGYLGVISSHFQLASEGRGDSRFTDVSLRGDKGYSLKAINAAITAWLVTVPGAPLFSLPSPSLRATWPGPETCARRPGSEPKPETAPNPTTPTALLLPGARKVWRQMLSTPSVRRLTAPSHAHLPFAPL